MSLRLALIALIVGGAWLALALTSEPGPNSWLTLIRRYGLLVVGPVPFIALAAYLWARPGGAVVVVAVSLTALVCRPKLVRNGWRRAVLRARWPSVARSCGLCVINDRRSGQWPGGAVVTITAERVEYLPTISWGRTSGPGATAWVLRPARGGTVDQVAEAAEALAAGLGVARVLVDRQTPSKGHVEVVWL